MASLDTAKVALYKKLTEELQTIDDEHFRLRDIIKTNHKYIRELRDDIDRWKETCFRQSDRIHKLYLISAIQFLISIGLSVWVTTLMIFY
jgi:hypothetical protein